MIFIKPAYGTRGLVISRQPDRPLGSSLVWSYVSFIV